MQSKFAIEKESRVNQTIQEAAEAFRHALSSETMGELSFPTSLDASRRVLKAVENPDIGLTALAKIVVAEPLLSAKVIRLANSVALNPTGSSHRQVWAALSCQRPLSPTPSTPPANSAS
jgi:hypothetical protein